MGNELKRGSYEEVTTAKKIASNVSKQYLEKHPEIIKLIDEIT